MAAIVDLSLAAGTATAAVSGLLVDCCRNNVTPVASVATTASPIRVWRRELGFMMISWEKVWE
jgi:hypothetical protein